MSLLPQLTVSGSHREIGLKVGKEFASRILDFILDSEVRILLVPFVSEEPGKSLFQDLIKANQTLYPSLFDELSGISEGSGLPLQEIYLINFYEILVAWAHKRDGQELKCEKSCSDICIKKENNFILGHSEDMPINNACRYCWMIDEHVTDEPSVKAFCYPGMFPGNAFSWNEHGIIITVNYIRSDRIYPNGASVPFMCRDFLRYKTISEIVASIPRKRASCISLNIISIHENRCVNLEIGIDAYALKEVEGNYYHVNHFRWLQVPHALAKSSTCRAVRIEALLPDVDNVLSVLSDTENKEFPVFRDGKAPDNNSTAAIVRFDVAKKSVEIYLENPKLNPNPKLTYSLSF